MRFKINCFFKKSALITLFLVGFLTISANAQETIWLNKNLNKTIQTEAVYYKLGNATDGAVSFFYMNKTIYRKVFFSDGNLNGKFLEYYNSGELKEIGRYEKGLREGVWKTYYKSGKIKERGKYKNGDKVGIWKTFYKNI
jgi:antitoxin component YwqK of YwqJK toxin-antitoxin module